MAREMKDSGIEWIGKIPVDWNSCRLRYLCDIMTGNQDTQDNDPNGIYPFYVRSPKVEKSNKYTFEGKAILMSGDGVGAGRIFHCVDGKYGCHQRVYSLQNINRVNFKYLFYYISNTFYVMIETANSKSTVDSVRLNMLQDFPVLVPRENEQHRIANFLDSKCAEIDRVLEKTRASIEEYKKLKQSVITQAVTKGVRGEREMKDSGIEWIGEIPAEWKISRIKYVSSFEPPCDTSRLSPDSVITYTPMEYIKNGYYVPNTATLSSLSTSLTSYQSGDIVMAKVTPCFENGNISIMNNLSSAFGLGSSELFVFRAKSIHTQFLFYWLRNNRFVQTACSTMTGTGGLKRVSSLFVKDSSLAVPPESEQIEIANYLDKKCSEIDTLISKKEQFITELESYKKSLIYEYVTGKKEAMNDL